MRGEREGGARLGIIFWEAGRREMGAIRGDGTDGSALPELSVRRSPRFVRSSPCRSGRPQLPHSLARLSRMKLLSGMASTPSHKDTAADGDERRLLRRRAGGRVSQRRRWRVYTLRSPPSRTPPRPHLPPGAARALSEPPSPAGIGESERECRCVLLES